MTYTAYSRRIERDVLDCPLIRISDNGYTFNIDGVSGTVTLLEGAALDEPSTRRIQEGRRKYGLWCLDQYLDEIVNLDDHDLSRNGWRSWHVLTQYGGTEHIVSAYAPDRSVDKPSVLPLEFDAWQIRRRENAQARPLWDAFSDMVAKSGTVPPEHSYLILNRLAITRTGVFVEAPYATQVCFAVSQLALEIYLREEPFQWVVSQQREELGGGYLAIGASRPLFRPAVETLGLDDSECLALAPGHPKLGQLRARYPGYWFDHDDLKRELRRDVVNEKYAAVFERLWDRMLCDGVPLVRGRELRRLLIPGNIKYLALVFAECPELIERYNRSSAPGPFCSITPRQIWFNSCRDIFDSAWTG